MHIKSSVLRPPMIELADVMKAHLLTHYAYGDLLPSPGALAAQLEQESAAVLDALAILAYAGTIKTGSSGLLTLAEGGRQHIAILSEADVSNSQTSFFTVRLFRSIHQYLLDMHVPVELYVGEYALAQYGSSIRTLSREAFERALKANAISGVLAIGASASLVEQIRERAIPMVSTSLISDPHLVHYPTVACMALGYLVRHGRKRIALIEHLDPSIPSPTKQALCKALEQEGLQVVDEWIVATLFGSSDHAGADAFRRLWGAREEKPDGLIVLNDILYRDLSPLLLYNQICVPDDLCIVSHANKGDDRPMLPLPVLLQVDPDAVAMAMANALIAEVRQVPFTENLPPSLSLIDDPGPVWSLALP